MLEGDFILVLYLLARQQAELVKAFRRPDGDVRQLAGAFFGGIKARIGAAVARGMALRALGLGLAGARGFLPAVPRPQDIHQHLAVGVRH